MLRQPLLKREIYRAARVSKRSCRTLVRHRLISLVEALAAWPGVFLRRHGHFETVGLPNRVQKKLSGTDSLTVAAR